MTMNVTNIPHLLSTGSYLDKNNHSVSEMIDVKPIPEIKNLDSPGVDLKQFGSQKGNQEFPNQKTQEKDLLLKPSPISLEERMSQVISVEQVRDLLSLITRFPVANEDQEHKLDVKR